MITAWCVMRHCPPQLKQAGHAVTVSVHRTRPAALRQANKYRKAFGCRTWLAVRHDRPPLQSEPATIERSRVAQAAFEEWRATQPKKNGVKP